MDPVQFDPDDEEFYGDMGSIGSAKFDTILTGSPLNDGSIPRGVHIAGNRQSGRRYGSDGKAIRFGR
ncbi:MAG: hypothetical protein Ct9H90mP16_16040 [Candidatus Poseidoniales archaeon]|nr:MAG: hypothetical protein Ct9H90mP16_16040 [Candidatus Poseidoniales archaeon]